MSRLSGVEGMVLPILKEATSQERIERLRAGAGRVGMQETHGLKPEEAKREILLTAARLVLRNEWTVGGVESGEGYSEGPPACPECGGLRPLTLWDDPIAYCSYPEEDYPRGHKTGCEWGATVRALHGK
jgi:hypothetical protein